MGILKSRRGGSMSVSKIMYKNINCTDVTLNKVIKKHWKKQSKTYRVSKAYLDKNFIIIDQNFKILWANKKIAMKKMIGKFCYEIYKKDRRHV